MRRLVLLLALVVAPVTQLSASSYFHHDPSPLGDTRLDADAAKSAWSAFESLQKATPGRLPDRPIGRFTNGGRDLLLAPDGRAALYFRGGDSEPDSAWLGRYAADGEWLQIDLHHGAVAPEAFDEWFAQAQAARIAWKAEMDAWQKEQEPRLRRFLTALESDSADELAALSEDEPDEFPLEYIEDLAAQDSESRQALMTAIRDQLEMYESNTAFDDESAMLDDPDGPTSGVSVRLLPTPHGDGWLLVDQGSVERMANFWNQYGRAFFSPQYWNDTPGPEEKIEHGWRQITYNAPLPANLPSAFTALLLNAPRLVTVSEWLDDPAEPTWKAHEATLRIRVDFNSAAGARAGMTLHGIAPDERWLATLTEVDEQGATAALKLQRFSPWEVVELPTRGLRFSTRSGRAQSETCGVDTSAAVQAKIIEVLDPEGGSIEWDEDGFAFVRLRIDQGRAQGLMTGDELSAEDYSFGPGEGRVESTESGQAVVLWRMQRFHSSMTVEHPAVGSSLVTPAWRRASYDTFGSWTSETKQAEIEQAEDASELH